MEALAGEEPPDMTELAIGIDIGGSWTRAALGDRKGRILRRVALPVETGDNRVFLKHLESVIGSMAGSEGSSVVGIGVGAAGRLDLKEGSVLFSPHTKLKDVAIRGHLMRRFKKPVVLLNDCVMAALAERRVGAGKGHDNLVYVGIGTGIGGGIIADGRIVLGKDGNAHEMGHMIIDKDGALPCECGGRGHWEAYTSGSGIPQLARLMAKGSGLETPLLSRLKKGEVESKDVFHALAWGDRFAREVVDECTRLNALALANLADLFDPEIIIIGGGVALKNREAIVGPLEAEVAKFSFNIPPKIAATPLGEDSPLIGSILSVFEPPFL